MPAKKKVKEEEHVRSPGIAAVLNFLIWGTGYIYNGKKLLKGIGLIIFELLELLFVIFSGFSWLIHFPGIMFLVSHLFLAVLMAYDAYHDGKK
ncbi:MAG: hypothetical protein HZB67_04690 [Candidatus Aenigmarchaeota archaeon]|nr:hypothetical protein [Candidatus Aenigmarchaeota archaeon]